MVALVCIKNLLFDLKKARALNADVDTNLCLFPTAWISTPNMAFEPQLDCAWVLLL